MYNYAAYTVFFLFLEASDFIINIRIGRNKRNVDTALSEIS